MGLTQAQRDLQKEAIQLAEAYERLCKSMPEDMRLAWYKLVGYLRDCYCMDETWDGKELKFYDAGRELIKVSLADDSLLFSFMLEGKEYKSVPIITPAEADNAIQMIDKTRLPARTIPTEIIAPNSGLCNVCLFNDKNIAARDRRAEMTMGFSKCYGDESDYTYQECFGKECFALNDIAHGTPGLTAEEVTHVMYQWWWAKSRLNPANANQEAKV